MMGLVDPAIAVKRIAKDDCLFVWRGGGGTAYR